MISWKRCLTDEISVSTRSAYIAPAESVFYRAYWNGTASHQLHRAATIAAGSLVNVLTISHVKCSQLCERESKTDKPAPQRACEVSVSEGPHSEGRRYVPSWSHKV